MIAFSITKTKARKLPRFHLFPEMLTILFKIITRMKLLFSNYLGDYSYSFQGSSELISTTVTVFLFSCRLQLQETIPLRHSQEFSAVTVTWFNGFRIRNLMISKRMVCKIISVLVELINYVEKLLLELLSVIEDRITSPTCVSRVASRRSTCFGDFWELVRVMRAKVSSRIAWNILGELIRNCLKYVQSDLVPSRLLPNSCLLNPGRGPKSNRTSRLFPGSL